MSDLKPPPRVFGAPEVLILLALYAIFSAVALFTIGFFTALAAIALLLAEGLVRLCGGIGPRRHRQFLQLVVILTIAAPFVYKARQYAVERLYVKPIAELNDSQHGGFSLHRQNQEVLQRQEREIESISLEEAPTLVIGKNPPRLDGATSLQVIYRSFAKAVYRAPAEIGCNRTSLAYENLTHGHVDMIFAFRPSQKQLENAAKAGKTFAITPIGYEAFVFFVNEKNPVNGLTSEQLRGIYSGRILNWMKVGGSLASIIPFQRSEGSGSQSRMERFMAGEKMLPPKKETIFQTMYNIVQTARYHNYRNSIGYSFLYYIDVMLEGGGVKLLEIDGVPPLLDTIRDGRYPLTDEICVVTAGTDNPHAHAFIDWMLSPQGQRIVELAGYTSLRSGSEEEKMAGRGL